MAPLNIEAKFATLLMSHLERSWSNAVALENTAEVDGWLVGANKEKKKWLDLYVYIQHSIGNTTYCLP